MNFDPSRIQTSRRALWRLLPQNIRAVVEDEAEMTFFCYSLRCWLMPSLPIMVGGLMLLAAWARSEHRQYLSLDMVIAGIFCLFAALILLDSHKKAAGVFHYRLETIKGLATLLAYNGPEKWTDPPRELLIICDRYLHQLANEVERLKALDASKKFRINLEEMQIRILPLRLVHGVLYRRGLAGYSDPMFYFPLQPARAD